MTNTMAADRDRSAELVREQIIASRPLVLLAATPPGATAQQLRAATRTEYPKKTRRERAAAVLGALKLRSRDTETDTMAKTITTEQALEVRAFIREKLQKDPSLSAKTLNAMVAAELGIKIAEANFLATYWKSVRVQLGLHKHRGGPSAVPKRDIRAERAAPTTEPVNRIAPHLNGLGAAVEDSHPEAAADEAFSAAVHGTAQPAVSRSAVPEEARSLPVLTVAEEHVSLEAHDGRWVLRVRFTFADQGAAVEALARVSLGLAKTLRPVTNR